MSVAVVEVCVLDAAELLLPEVVSVVVSVSVLVVSEDVVVCVLVVDEVVSVAVGVVVVDVVVESLFWLLELADNIAKTVITATTANAPLTLPHTTRCTLFLPDADLVSCVNASVCTASLSTPDCTSQLIVWSVNAEPPQI